MYIINNQIAPAPAFTLHQQNGNAKRPQLAQIPTDSAHVYRIALTRIPWRRTGGLWVVMRACCIPQTRSIIYRKHWSSI